MKDIEHFERLIKAMAEVIELKKEMKEEATTDERFEEIKDQYYQMYEWALGQKEFNGNIDELNALFIKKHPDLPSIYLPNDVCRGSRDKVIMMQLIPLWIKHGQEDN